MAERRPSSSLLAAVGLAVLAAVPVHAADDTADDRNVQVRVGANLTRDDNLYRLPEGVDPAVLLGADARRGDRIQTTSVGLTGHWPLGEQAVSLDTSAAAHRFDANEALDNTSANAGLQWDWLLGKRWSGEVAGRRERTLASFENTESLRRDVVDTTAYRGLARFAVGSRWQTVLGARRTETLHGDAERRRHDVDMRVGSAGLEYRTPAGNSVGWEYRGAEAVFATPLSVAGVGSASDYEERAASVNMSYAPASEVLVRASVGYVERDYPSAGAADFSGDVWSAAFQWSPKAQVRLALESWRELKAYLDAESDHFVATGSGVTVAWLPHDRVEIALQASREERRYIGFVADASDETMRHDTPTTRSLKLTYAANGHLSVDASYRHETRESNRFRFDYDAELLTVGCELKF